jgi:WD40 repeat protein
MKAVSAIDIDPAGNIIITGGRDYQINIYDLQDTNNSLHHFHLLQPFEGYPITSLHFNNSGDNFIVTAGENSAKIYTRDGIKVKGTVKGDIYIRDLKHTKGHTLGILDGKWHPVDKNIFLTSSLDGTLRLWDLMSKSVGLHQNIVHKFVMQMKEKNGVKSPGCTAEFNNNGKLIAGACQDGSIHIWHERSHYANPDLVQLNAHEKSEITAICFHTNGNNLYSRAVDSTVKLWDLRKFATSVKSTQAILNGDSKSSLSFGPNENLLLAPINIMNTANQSSYNIGKIAFLNPTTLDILANINICRSSTIRCLWQAENNQIFITCGDGVTRVLYNPNISKNGIMNCLCKKAKTTFGDHIEYEQPIFTNYTTNQITRNKMESMRIKEMGECPIMREGPITAKKPESTRKVNDGSGLTIFVPTQTNKINNWSDNPQETLLKFAQVANEHPEQVDPAHSSAQPSPVFDFTAPAREETKFIDVEAKKCEKCGKGFCPCKESKNPREKIEEEEAKKSPPPDYGKLFETYSNTNIRLKKSVRNFIYICKYTFNEIPELSKWWEWWSGSPYKFKANGTKYHTKFAESLPNRFFDIPDTHEG